MKEFLNNYLKYVAASNLETGDFAGPVVTISRQTGCSARRIAIKLSKILTGYSYMSDTKTDAEWQWTDKDSFKQAIREMQKELNNREKKDPELQERLDIVTDAFSTEKFIDNFDEKTAAILKDLLVKLAIQGRFIILGRGATTVLSDLPNKLSVRLEAPVEWRINRVAQVKNLSHQEAESHVQKADEKRQQFTKAFIGRTYTNSDFDVIFNYASLSDSQIVDAIVNILKSKKIIAAHDD